MSWIAYVGIGSQAVNMLGHEFDNYVHVIDIVVV